MTVHHYVTEDEAAGQQVATVATVAPSTNPTLSIRAAYNAFPQDTSNYLDCVYSLTGVPGQADVHVTGRVRGRGNDTWGKPKKPFKVKLDDSVPMLGLPTSKDWTLLANYNDTTGIANTLAFRIGSLSTGLAWTPRSGYVDLYFNGDYLGNYQLAEGVQFAATRVNATKATGTTGLPSTGAYLLEVGIDTDQDKAAYLTTHGVNVNADDPDGSTPAQWTYISGWLQNFEDVLYGAGFADPTTGYRTLVDVPSLIDWYLIEEFASNVEGGFASSCKCYKTADTAETPGRLYMGPLWDFDRSFGSPQSGDATGYRVRPGAKWLDRMFADPTFAAEAATRWVALKAAITAAGGLNKIISTATARVASAQARDARRWGYTYSWADELATKKAFVAARMAWMDSVFV